MSEEQESLSKARLTVMLNDLLSGEGKLRYTSSIPLIYNEHAPVSKLLWDIMVESDVLCFIFLFNFSSFIKCTMGLQKSDGIFNWLAMLEFL